MVALEGRPALPEFAPPVEPTSEQSLSRGSPGLRRLLLGGDIAALAAAWLPLLVLTHASRLSDGEPVGAGVLLGTVVVSTLASICYARARHLYRSRVCSIKEHERALLVGVAVVSAISGDLVLHHFGAGAAQWAVLAEGVLAFVALVAVRSVYREWLNGQRRKNRFTRPTVVLGGGGEARDWCKLVQECPEFGIELRGIVGEVPGELEDLGVPWLGYGDDVVAAVHRVGATSVMVMVTAFSTPELRRLLRELTRAHVHIQISTGLMGFAHDRFTMTTVSHENLLYVEPRPLPKRSLHSKRIFDVVVAGTALVVALPILAVASFGVWLQDRGPVLFRQERIGRHGTPFRLYKLRTMVPNAEARRHELAQLNLRDGPLFKVSSDPRITKIGRILRTTSIDELPQLINVLRGHMSLVGPRPALADEVAQFDSELLARHDVQPGITGLWQVEGRDAVSFDSYRRLDLHYVENWSIVLDVKILCATAASLIGRTLRALPVLRGGRQIAA